MRPPSASGCHDGAMMLVTGATGYLGSALVELAVRRGLAVRAAVRDAGKSVV